MTAPPCTGYDHAARRSQLLHALPALLPMQSAYHAGWVVLQLLGIISGLDSERAHIVRHVRALARARPIASVYVAGSADCGLLSVLHEAFGADIAGLDVRVADRSPVPLALCRQYAAAMGFPVALEVRDLGAPPGPAERRYDLVLTHSLLSFIAPHARAALVGHLAARLEVAGSLLLYQSVRARHGSPLLAYSPEQVDSMVGASLAAQRSAARCLPMLTEHELEGIVRAFCAAKITHALASEDELVHSARAAGLAGVRCEPLSERELAGHRPATPESRYVKWMLQGQRAA
ncbi:class I SAM-dependent methyltransferase [Massilia sp. DJPM01]|uniref:class I SAM-dependent methyltransferase n=1 Tax=Massilia sp. DJPM01 TaxID=3024404 RepID=UPI00259F7029|nr:class I SAM-dependent methyltransferase [Massilia sp. DJPM01]MDM5180835.1 class I SAM-dependent methyltransferase [Massilia sp. DJPM01]